METWIIAVVAPIMVLSTVFVATALILLAYSLIDWFKFTSNL